MIFEDALIVGGGLFAALFVSGLMAILALFRLRDLLRRSLHLRILKQSGNVFFMLFGAVAIAGLIGVSTMTTMKGSMRGVAQSNQIAAANNTLYSAARLIAGAAQGEDDDCDSDGIVEPPPWRDEGAVPAPVGGGLVPGHIGAGKRDPWGADIGYCVWDHGNRTVSHDVTACGGAAANRLEGTDEKTEYVIAVISAGPDRIFETACNPWEDADDDGQPDTPLIVTAPGSDDIVRAETITALFAEGNTNQLQQLPDEACTPDTVGTLRYDAGTMQVCRETGWQEVGGAILASGNFLPVTGAALDSEHTSNAISFTGFFGTRTASVDDGAILIVNGLESGGSATIAADDTIALKADAASAPATTATFTLSVSTLRRTWTITTRDPTPAALVMTPPANGTMDVTGPGSPAYGTTVRFTVRNSGETPSAVLAAAQLSNSTNFTFDASGANVGDACSGQTLGHNETCFIDVRPRASVPGAFSGTLTVSDGTLSDDSALAGNATGWPCSLPWGGSIPDGDSVTAYLASSVACGQACSSVQQTRTCTNGSLSGGHTNGSCSVAACADCSSTTINWSPGCSASSGSMTHGETKSVNNSAAGHNGTRNLSCNNGTISQSGGSCTATCGGYSYGGHCYYYGGQNKSCTETCASRGGCDSTGTAYIGSSGTNGRCQAVLTGLRGSTSVAQQSGSGLGCYYNEHINTGRRRPSSTSCGTKNANVRRACACNN